MMCNPVFKSIRQALYPVGLCMAMLVSGALRAEQATINFRDVELITAIESIAAITNKTFIVDPRVRGKISIVSDEPIDEKTLYDVFLSALTVHGFQAVSDGNAISIIPAAKAAGLSNDRGSGEFITEVLRVRHSEAGSVAKSISDIAGAGAKISVHEGSNSLIVTDTQAQINRYRRLLSELDADASQPYDIIKLHNTSAKEVMAVATALGIIDNQSRVVEDVTANRLIVSGPHESRIQIKALVRKLDSEPASAGQAGVDVIYLDHAKASTLQPLLENMLQSSAFKAATGEVAGAKDEQGVASAEYYSVQADEISNTLIVAGPANVTAAVKGIVAKLDKPRPQVLIEAVIAEVSESFFNELSVNLAALGNYGVFVTDFNGALTSIGSAVAGDSSDAASALGSVTSTPLFGAASINRGNGTGIAALIQAIKTDNKSTLLSTPSILTLENELATISIGQEVPFVTGSYTTNASGSGNPFQTIEREEVGTILKVRPQISNDQTIRLEIDQEVSNVNETFVQGTLGTNPTTDKKLIETNVMVRDGQTLVLGGLIDSKFANVERKVPLLGDIPLLGQLFRSRSRSKDASVLMVFIRPTILRTEGDGNILTRSKYRVLQQRQQEFIIRNDLKGDVWSLPEDIGRIGSLDEMVR